MSREQKQPETPSFAQEYPEPTDQMAFEFDLVHSFNRQYPIDAPALKHALLTLGDFTDQEKPRNGTSRLTLRIPPEQDGGLTGSMDETSVSTVGPMPGSTHDLLEGLYGLVGAKVLRDDHQAGEATGQVLREGKYNGKPIYIAEQYSAVTNRLTVLMMDVKQAQMSLKDLSQSERQEFKKVSGIKGGGLIHVHETHGVTRDNYKQVAHTIGQTREVVNSAGKGRFTKLAGRLGRLVSGR